MWYNNIMKYEKIKRLEETDPELVIAINTVIHDFNNLYSMMSAYARNQDNPTTDYNREHGWRVAKEYWEERGQKVKDKVKKLTDILYE